MHTVYLGLGANLGDRQNNLVQALQLLRSQMTIEQVSSCYETAPVGYTEQPAFINIACRCFRQHGFRAKTNLEDI